jgi:hypothetical protein
LIYRSDSDRHGACAALANLLLFFLLSMEGSPSMSNIPSIHTKSNPGKSVRIRVQKSDARRAAALSMALQA